jgi:hypothetical protein
LASFMAPEMISGIVRRLAPTRIGASVMHVIESLLFGGELRERPLSRMLLALGDSKFRRQWMQRPDIAAWSLSGRGSAQ